LGEKKSEPEENVSTWAFTIIWVASWAILGGVIMVSLDAMVARRRRRQFIASGIYPGPGTETEEDARRLLQAGHTDMAIRCYRAVHQLGYQQAKDELLGTKSAGYGILPVGLIFGLSMGLFLRNHTVLGAGLGLLLGVSLVFFVRKFSPRDKGPQ
jgi:hypothetical protein